KVSIRGKLVPIEVPFHTDPVVERLHWQMDVGGGFQFNDREASSAIGGKHVEDAAIAACEGGYLAIDRLRAQPGVDCFDLCAGQRFEPRFRVAPVERVQAVGGFRAADAVEFLNQALDLVGVMFPRGTAGVETKEEAVARQLGELDSADAQAGAAIVSGD